MIDDFDRLSRRSQHAVSCIAAALLLAEDALTASTGSDVRVSSGKPEASPPGNPQHAWAVDAMLRALERANVSEQFGIGPRPSIEARLIEQLDRHRPAHSEPRDDPAPRPAGRPVGINRQHVQRIASLYQQGMNLTQLSKAGVIPERTFWEAIKRGKERRAGVEYELLKSAGISLE